ncbi:hypothetical protein C0J08_03660 [Marinomonas sp. CT5]|uniref:glycosyltransferase family 2 protein n=1 Tax=Marinomonas sp. CT5 TaxID=2066133 RepID=UPI001BAE6138|nr:glycosyltransferase [Marinomonas sp. CT5]QUX94562.1 hypothetical protein C0J08_03660 [Marinomonas sp. CT5]
MYLEDSERPLISVLMNCYNGEKYLREALDSIVAQTYDNWELIFWDNQSSDNSKSILEEYLPDSRIKYFYAPTHTNLGGGRAAAWSYIKGKYLGVLDVDDLWEPSKLEEQVSIMESDPEIGVCISNTKFFSEKHSEVLYDSAPPVELGVGELIRKYYISLESVLLSMDHAKNLDEGFSNDFSHIADFDLIVRIASSSKIHYVPKVLSAWRVHESSGTWTDSQQFNFEFIKWVSKYKNSTLFYRYSNELAHIQSRALLRSISVSFAKLKFKEIFTHLSNESFLIKLRTFLILIFYIPFSNVFFWIRKKRFQRKWW